MKTDEFESIVNLISYCDTENDNIIIELNNLHLKKDFNYSIFIEPFSKELNKNILKHSSMEYKIDVTSFYLFKLREISGLFIIKNKDLLFQIPTDNEELDEFDSYVVNSHFLFNMILVEIQYCCGKYNIDFGGICKKVNLNRELFDNGIALYFDNIKNEADITIEKNETSKAKKQLLEFIDNVENKEAFLLDLKDAFPTEIGKSMKAIIDILDTHKIIIIGTKEFKQLFDELKKYFNRDIGTYNSIQNVKGEDKEITETIQKRLIPLINKHKKT
jgi:hypothetical protein